MRRVRFYLWLAASLVVNASAAFAQDAPRPLQVAITFDDLPAHGALPPKMSRLEVAQQILGTIKRENLPPIFGFVNAVRVQEAPETMAVLRAWRDAGEPLGSHTWSHPDLEQMTPEAFEADVEKNETPLAQLEPNADWHWFRYPFLHEGETLEKQQTVRAYLQQHKYRIAEVSLDFEDYLWNAPYARCLAKQDTTSLQYLHDSYLSTADNYFTIFRYLSHELYGHDIPYVLLLHLGAFDAKMFPELLALMRSRGFAFVSLPEAEADPAYAEEPKLGAPGGGPLQEVIAARRKVKFPPNTKPYQRLEKICR